MTDYPSRPQVLSAFQESYLQAIHTSDLHYGEAAYLTALVLRATPTGIVLRGTAPTYKELGDLIGVGRNVVPRLINNLEADGWFQRFWRGNSPYPGRGSYGYRLSIPASATAAA